jgi:ketosteroid isomerase-like protein
MQRSDAVQFAQSWIDAWNRRDIEHVLDCYVENLTFTSPTALEVMGHATVVGKDALRAYWEKAMSRVNELHFTLDRVLWDEATRELALVYTRVVNGTAKRAVETFVFDASGQVTATDVFHGPVPA